MDWFHIILGLRLAGISFIYIFYGYASVQLNTKIQRIIMWILSAVSIPYLWIVYRESINENYGHESKLLASGIVISLAIIIPISFLIGRRKSLKINKEDSDISYYVKFCLFFVVFYSVFEFLIVFIKARKSNFGNLIEVLKDIASGLPYFAIAIFLWIIIWGLMKLIKRGSRELALVISVTIVAINFNPIVADSTLRILHPFRAILFAMVAQLASIFGGLLLAKQGQIFSEIRQNKLKKLLLFCLVYYMFIGFFDNFMMLNKQSPFGTHRVPNNSEWLIVMPLLNFFYFGLAGNLISNKRELTSLR